MSLIHRIAAIVDTNTNLDNVSFMPNKVTYDDDISILPVKLEYIIGPPPKNSSTTTQKELEIISRLTKNRSKSEIELIYTVDEDPLALFYGFMDKKNIAFPKQLFDEYYNILEQYVYALKYYFNRARPIQVAPYYNIDIDVLETDTHHTPSYPSGHTMYSELAAWIASSQYPEHSKAFFRLSEYCGFARILQGVHYQSDNEASQLAVRMLFPLIKDKYEQKSQNFPIDIQS